MTDKCILLVEDNPDDEELTLRALRMHNIANPVIVARDGQEALDHLLDADNPVPALVLLDLRLPKIGGLDVLARMRREARLRLVPVVILTTSTEERDVLAGYKNGGNSYIRKPVDFSQFAEAVRQLGMYWLVLNEPPPAVSG